MFDIIDKVALVTGGASGIGLEYVKNLLKNGCKGVAIIDVNEDLGKKFLQDLQEKFGQERLIFIKADVSNKNELEGAFEETVQKYNQLDIVINNAGIFNENDIEKCVSVNLIAVLQGSTLAYEKYLPKYMKKEGVIVNTASITGLAYTQIPIYSCTKHAVVAFGKCFSYTCEESNIRILTICPGLTTTSLNNDVKDPDIWNKVKNLLDPSKTQSAEEVGKALITVLKDGANGSNWVIDQNILYEVNLQPQNIR